MPDRHSIPTAAHNAVGLWRLVADRPTLAWEHSGWITEADGSSARLTELRAHIQEVSDFLKSGNASINGSGGNKSISKDYLQGYLADLLRREKTEAAQSAPSAANRASFTRARFLP